MSILNKFIKITLLLGMTLPGLAFSGGRGRGGSSDGAGGGTFVLKQGKKNLVFWDLWQDNQDFEDKMTGEKLRLSPAGLAAHGEWVDSRKLKAHAFIEKALISESNKVATGLMKIWLQQVGADEVPMIFTDLPIAKITELAVPDGFRPENTADVKAIAGAYFDGRSNRIYINIEVWNRAGLKSQAALLLHERLRALQPYFNLSNNELQNAVAEVIDTGATGKDHRKNDLQIMFSAKKDFGMIRRLPLSPASGSRSPVPAANEIQEARVVGILGEAGAPLAIASIGEKDSLGRWNGKSIFDSSRCGSFLQSDASKRIGSDFRCLKDGFLGGYGTLMGRDNSLFLGGSGTDKNISADIEVLGAEGKSKFAFEAEYLFCHTEKGVRAGMALVYQDSLKIDFETEGEIVRMTMNGQKPVEIPKRNLLSSGDARKINIQVYPEENRIEVSSRYSMWDIPVASWYLDLGENCELDRFSFSMEEGTILRSFYAQDIK